MTDVRARTSSGARNGLRFLLGGLIAVFALLNSSCGNQIFIVGTPVLTLGAKRGHFTSYIVTIDEIQMTRRDGTVVELPTISQRVDLAQLNDFSDLLEAPALGVGNYVSATFFLDYSSPSITVDNGGQAAATQLVDINGNAPVTETVTVKFDPNHPLTLTSQTSALAAFNIDLEASNTIDYSTSPIKVTVKPFWTVTAQPVYDKPVFARGLYVLTNAKDSNFIMNVRPLHDVLDNPFGALTVLTNDQTYYNIDGVTYVGAAGLTALSNLQNTYANLQVGVYGGGPGLGNPFGDLDKVTPSFAATAVYVGTSLESTVQDHIVGIVSARSGDTFTVMGAALVNRLGQFGFQQSTSVKVGPQTVVSVDGNANITPSLDLISVGQLVNVSGQVTVDSSNNPTSLDATGAATSGAQVRIQPTHLQGAVNSVTPGSLSLNLQTVEGWETTNINYAGTGLNSGVDATPANYTINTGSLDESSVAPGTLVDVLGTANTFGTGPPYFTTNQVTPITESQLIIEWSGTGSLTPFTTVNATGIIVNLTDPNLQGTVHQVRTGPTAVDVMSQANPQQLTISYAPPTPDSPNLFGVGNVALGESIYADPQAFATQVLAVINGSQAANKLVATGQYDPSTSTFTASKISINAQ